MAKLLDSPFGRSLTAIRENERRARFLGVPVEYHIWLSFVISCLFVSVAGALYALLNNFTDPRALRFDLSGNFVIMAVLGGMRFSGDPDRRRDFRCTAGLRVQPHRKLDVGHRSGVRTGGALLSARRPGHVARRSQGMTLLQVNGASKRFGSLVAIDDVSLSIEPGELRAIIGPNGAGKTTFFNLVSGLFAPTTGAILFEGQDITALPPQERVQRGMARTFQITEIFPELSVADNIRVAVEIAAGYRLKPWLGAEARAAVAARVAELLEMGGLADKGGVRAGALSHGDQRAAEIRCRSRSAPASSCSTSRPRAWAIRKLTTSRGSSGACIATGG